MPLSVNVTLEVIPRGDNPANPLIKLHIRADGMSGTAISDWDTLICGGEVTGIISPPTGRGLQPSRKRMKQASMKQEDRSARALGGRRQSGSGARPGNKGDGQVLDQEAIDNLEGAPGRFRIENKYVTGGQATIKLRDLTKIRAECTGREAPIFDVQFKEKVTLRTLDNWVLIPRREFENLVRNTRDDS